MGRVVLGCLQKGGRASSNDRSVAGDVSTHTDAGCQHVGRLVDHADWPTPGTPDGLSKESSHAAVDWRCKGGPLNDKRPQGWRLPIRYLGWPFEQAPDAVQAYWNQRARELGTKFSGVRGTQRDTAVRGSANEDIVAAFLSSTLHPRRIVKRTSIIDASGHQSGEVDIAVCNEDQPLLGQDGDSPLLIIEGVDVVIQVKARLTSKEIERIRDNCMSVKSLHKLRGSDDDHHDNAHADPAQFLDHEAYAELVE